MVYRAGVDIGGTFTDIVTLDEGGRFHVAKTPTTPDDYTLGVLNAIHELKLDLKDVIFFCHGTTVTTNAMLEGKFERTGVIATKGFRDIVELRRGERVWPDVPNYLFNLQLDLPQRYLNNPIRPLTLRRDRYEVTERVNYKGEILKKLDESDVVSVINKLKRAGLKSIAVSFIFSYMYPQHEKRVKELITQHYPEAYVSISSEVLPVIREYERTSTTVINSCVGPIISKYLNVLEEKLQSEGFSNERDVLVMGSNGGIMTARSASERAAHTILSGPAGGVIGAQVLGSLIGEQNIITISMGGTSFDVALIDRGETTITNETHVGAYYRLATPMIAIHTIGAGGGSIAWIDPGGALRVGPQSAGAKPGPACYDVGGIEPTVTDANVILGYLNPGYFLGGKMQLNVKAAEKAVTKLGDKLGMSMFETAFAIHEISDANMAAAIRVVSVERGRDPRDYAIICFGSGGPTQAVRLAELMSVPKVIVPETPGAFCCWGFLVTNVMHDYLRSYITPTSTVDFDLVNKLYEEMEQEGFRRVKRDGVPEDKIIFARNMDLRYIGQAHEVTVPTQNCKFNRKEMQQVVQNFHTLHEKLYATMAEDEPTEIITLGVKAIGLIDKPKLKELKEGTQRPEKALKNTRKAYSDYYKKFVDHLVYDRHKLAPGNVLIGPAIVEQVDTTTVIPTDAKATVDRYGNLIVKIGG